MAVADYLPFVPRPPARFVTEKGERVHGVIARFKDPAAVYHAAEKVRDAGYKKWDVHAPFPIHGIEEAIGEKRTKLPLIVAAGGFTGAGLGFLMQYWMSAVDYELVVQGKNFGDWEPFLMVTFELGILFAAFSALFGMLALNGLPRFNHPLLKKTSFLASSDDAFFIHIEADDKKFSPEETRALLESTGGYDIELVEDA